MTDRMEPVPGSEPEGSGFGKPWRPQPGVTFLAEGAFVRSLVDISTDTPIGLVGIDVQGRWNHGANDTLSLICHPQLAAEFGRWLIEAAEAAKADEREYR